MVIENGTGSNDWNVPSSDVSERELEESHESQKSDTERNHEHGSETSEQNPFRDRNDPAMTPLGDNSDATIPSTPKDNFIYHKGGNRARQGITIASWNIRGKQWKSKQSKWPYIIKIIRTENIGILALQETRLNETEKTKLMNAYPRILLISNSNSTAKKGVAFVINQRLLRLKENEIKVEFTIPNRVIDLAMKWGDQERIQIINVYVPNRTKEKIGFIKTLQNIKINKEEKLCLLGDFNLVENPRDRLPPHEDNRSVLKAFRELKNKLTIHDGWRLENEDKTNFTFEQKGTGALARIDRIYMNENVIPWTKDWSIGADYTLSDHSIITCKITEENSPERGRGIWKLPNHIINNPEFHRETKKELIRLQKWSKNNEKKNKDKTEKQKEESRNKNCNIQTKWNELKKRIILIGKRIDREMKNKERKNVKDILRKLDKAYKILRRKDNNWYQKNLAKGNIPTLRKELNKIQKVKIERKLEAARLRHVSLGETCSKYWFRLKKEKLLSNTIYNLKDRNDDVTNVMEEMIDIATEYHEKLQTKPEMMSKR
ncbi:Endonuclease/exonuclease/phosphatase [Hysterangium stoloniferum]|nr:Endonuclease/exonuclease/phosphatase [Hysterangium stoloniferum]